MRTRILLPLLVAMAGCGDIRSPATATPAAEVDRNEVNAARARLSAEDRDLVDAQEWCVISTDQPLGSMGPPVKLSIKGEPVFLCCAGCKRKAEADPDKTLAKLAELKAKKAGGK